VLSKQSYYLLQYQKRVLVRISRKRPKSTHIQKMFCVVGGGDRLSSAYL
jgi:hypothetical protein